MTETTPQCTPGEFFQRVRGQKVAVHLYNGTSYIGKLRCIDGCMNLAMDDCEEVVNGNHTSIFGTSFIRGNNVWFVKEVKE